MKIRDKRDKGWFWLDNEYLNGYAKHLGATCTVVYLSLCRHSDNETQSCFPSMKLIAEENGISTKTVERATKKLEEWSIISIERSKREDGTQANNVYTLLAKRHWKQKPTDIKSHGTDRQKVAKPTDKNDESRQTPVLHNYTHINYTHINKAETSSAGINEVIKKFETINPACKKYYGNTTQRKACQNLIDEYGLERVLVVIEKTLPKTNVMEFFPKITTPVQLFDKWAMLEAKIREHQNKIIKTKNNVI